MAGFAFLFAPIAFAHVGPTPAFAATIAACVHAITVTGDVLGIIAVIATLLGRLNSPRVSAVIIALVAIAIAFGAIETSIIVPKMQTTPLLTPAYDSLHRQSSAVYSVILVAALAAFIGSLSKQARRA